MLIDLAKSDFGSIAENVTRLKVSNMYIVENPLSVSGYSYIARPTLESFANIPGQTVRGIWYQSINGSTDVYVVAGTTLYRLSKLGEYTAVGIITGSGLCTFTSTTYNISIASDGALFIFDGAVVTPVAIPDDQYVGDVTSLDNYIIIGIKNSNKFYWINPGDTTIDPLSFTSAERNPDDIVTLTSVGDELWVLGQNTVEIFTDSGDANAPFIRIPGRVYQLGCEDKHSLVRTIKDTLPCLIWVTPSKEVVLAQGTPAKISNVSVEELLKGSTRFTGWAFRTNKHDFYVLNTDTVTLVYDISVNLWYRWSSYLQDTWKAASGLQITDSVYAVSDDSGEIYKLSSTPKDLEQDYLVCEVGGFVPNPTRNPIKCSSVSLSVNYGFSNSYTTDPLVEVRWSDDGGSTWSTYKQGALGKRGNYGTDVTFRSLGQIIKPGRYFEFRFSEVQPFRLDGAVLN